MFSHWSDLQKYEVQWQDHNDRRGEAEASNNCTETMEKECGQVAINTST